MHRSTRENPRWRCSRERLLKQAFLTVYACAMLGSVFATAPAAADRVLLFRTATSRVNDHYAGEVWAGNEVVVRLRSGSETDAQARADAVVARLTQLALTGLSAGDVTAAPREGTWALLGKGETIVTADAATVAASNMSAQNLCESWRKRLATMVREPYLTVDRADTILIPFGESRMLRFGGTIPGQVLVQSLADGTVAAQVIAEGKAQFVGGAVGTTAVSLRINDLNHMVVVEVKKWAAQVSGRVMARVRGGIIDEEMGLLAAANAVLANARREPGAQVRLLEMHRDGAGYLAKVSAHGPDYIAVSRDVSVDFGGGLTPIPQAVSLLLSNYPEKVPAPQTLMRQELITGVPTRIYWHHVNDSVEPLRFDVRVVNAGDQPARVRACWAQSGPGVDEVFVGFTAMLRFWEVLTTEKLIQALVPARSACSTATLDAKPGRIVSGMMHLIADEGGELYAEVIASRAGADAQAVTPMPAAQSGPLGVSTYAFDANLALAMEYDVGGAFAHATIGRDAIVNDQGFRLEGAYGVMHSVVIEMRNPTANRGKVEVVVRAGGGVGRVIARIDGALHSTHMLGAGEEQVLTSRYFMPGQSHTMRMQVMPTAGSNLPNTLIVRGMQVQ